MKNIYNIEIGKRIKSAREKVGLNQTTLGERVGINKQNIASYEQGRAQPDAETLSKIASIVDVDVMWLINGKTTEEINDDFKKSKFGRARDLRDEDFKIITYLHERNIFTVEEIKLRMEFYEQVNVAVKKVAEPKTKYPTNKKGGKT